MVREISVHTLNLIRSFLFGFRKHIKEVWQFYLQKVSPSMSCLNFNVFKVDNKAKKWYIRWYCCAHWHRFHVHLHQMLPLSMLLSLRVLLSSVTQAVCWDTIALLCCLVITTVKTGLFCLTILRHLRDIMVAIGHSTTSIS